MFTQLDGRLLILTLHAVLLAISFLPSPLSVGASPSRALRPGTAPAAIWLWNIIWNSHAFKVDTAGAISQHSRGVLTAPGGGWWTVGSAAGGSPRELLANRGSLWKRNGSTAMFVNVLIVTDSQHGLEIFRGGS